MKILLVQKPNFKYHCPGLSVIQPASIRHLWSACQFCGIRVSVMFCDPSLPLINCVWPLDSFLICKTGRFKTLWDNLWKEKKHRVRATSNFMYPFYCFSKRVSRTNISERTWGILGECTPICPCQGFHVQVSLYWTLTFFYPTAPSKVLWHLYCDPI